VSQSAFDAVAAYAHPKVKAGGRALLKAIAELIPEGQTTTGMITVDDLAAKAWQHRRTVFRWLDVLIEIGAIRVVDGGRGIIARYELLLVAGVRPIAAAPLPLVGAAPRRARTRQELTEPAPTLFDPPRSYEETAINVWRSVTRWAVVRMSICHTLTGNVWRFVTRWANVWRSVTRSALPQGVPITEDASSTYVRSKKDPDPERTYEQAEEDARARDVHTFLTWWMATFPQFNGGAVYALDRPRDEPIVRALLDHGRPLDLLQAMAVLLWTTTTDGVVGSNRWWIAVRCTDRGLFALKHKANYLAREVSLQWQEAADAPDVWAQVLRHLESLVDRHTFYTWFSKSILVQLTGDILEVAAESDAHATFIEKHYHDVLRAAVDHVQPGARVVFVTDKPRQKYG